MKLWRCGRYDGQTFVKPPEVLTRDRLLGMYEVKPALSRLKTTLLGTGGVLLLSGSILFGIIASSADADGVYGEITAAVHDHAASTENSLVVCSHAGMCTNTLPDHSTRMLMTFILCINRKGSS